MRILVVQFFLIKKGLPLVSRIMTVAFEGIRAIPVDVQVSISNGLPAFTIVGLPDKAVGESRERVRAALEASGVGLPAKRITVNLAPADLQKEGSHYDLPIALALLGAAGGLPQDLLTDRLALGELSLDGQITRVDGVMPAAFAAADRSYGLVCPAANGSEAAWAADERGRIEVLAPSSLMQLVNHFKGSQMLGTPEAMIEDEARGLLDLKDIKGQEAAKRVLEVVAAGGHNLLMSGPPGSGKSMLAARLPGLLPPLSPREALEVSMIHSVAGQLADGRLLRYRPFRDPHHSASQPALIGGGLKVRPGEVSLAHRGVLFLDELPEFKPATLEALRQPIETGEAVVARANAHLRYPARFQLVAAMNPCRCGHLGDADLACTRAPRCAQDYQAKISGPLFDRIDCHIDVPAVPASDLSLPPPREGTAEVAVRVQRARDIATERYALLPEDVAGGRRPTCNGEADGEILTAVATPDDAGQALLSDAASRLRLSARAYHRVLRVSRTLADLEGVETVGRVHVAEALSYRRIAPGR